MSKPDAEPKGKTHRFAVKDWLGVAFSALALLISCASFYFSNVRIVDNAHVRPLRIRSLEPAESGRPEDSSPGQVDAAFVNSGNRPAVIVSAAWVFRLDPNGGAEARFTSSFEMPSQPVFPLLVAPNDVRIASVNVPTLEQVDRALSLAAFPLQDRLWGYIEFIAINSRGQLYRAETAAIFTLFINENGGDPKAASIQTSTSQGYQPLIPLFEHPLGDPKRPRNSARGQPASSPNGHPSGQSR